MNLNSLDKTVFYTQWVGIAIELICLWVFDPSPPTRMLMIVCLFANVINIALFGWRAWANGSGDSGGENR